MAEDEGYDAAIIGAGAAGLMAALRAAERGRRVLLLEKGPRPGVKILMSGGTRCNITNAAGGAREIVEAFGPNGRFLWPGLKALDPRAVVALFEASGVPTKVEDDIVKGKVFPVSDRAADVVAALVTRMERAGAELRVGAAVTAVRAREGGGFSLETARGPVLARKVVIATGGLSYPSTGTTGDGYAFARAFGHTVTETRPALVPLVTDDARVHALRGVTVPRARLKAEVGGRPCGERTGSLLFTHFGLSGPVALDLSSALARVPAYPRGAAVTIDLLPDTPAERVDENLRLAAGNAGSRLVKNAMPQALPGRLGEHLALGFAKVPAERRLSELSKDERRRIVECVKALRVPVSGDKGYAMAEVTTGGVLLDEVDPRTLESKRQPGLHLVGEVLDLDGPIGGFNFQAAWSTGWLCAEGV